MSDKCPCCGSPFDAQMQITNLKERLEAWREFWRIYKKIALWKMDKLKDLGEI